MKKRLYPVTLTILSLFMSMGIIAQSMHGENDPYDVRFLEKGHGVLDPIFQKNLRDAAPWSAYKMAHPTWQVAFDEDNQKPFRAFGKGIQTMGVDAEDMARNFIQEELGGFGIPSDQLELQTVTENGKHYFVFFEQMHDGLEVLFSPMMVKMTYDGEVISWSAKIHEEISVSTEPSITPLAAAEAAGAGIPNAPLADVSAELAILPVPGNREYNHHLVYRAELSFTTEAGIPARYNTLVDAHSGEVLYRFNEVHSMCSHDTKDGHIGHHGQHRVGGCAHSPAAAEQPLPIEVTFTADHIIFDPSEPTVTSVMPEMRVTLGGDISLTDVNGVLTSDETGPQDATVRLRGAWARIFDQQSGASTPFADYTIADGVSTIDVTGDFADEAISGFLNTNIIHDFLKQYFPEFDGMDFELPVNIGITPSECNAFYDGSSINFYLGVFDCVSLVLVADVVFHEYGHGINNTFYLDNGVFFNNGGMNEGYADFWGYMVYEDPVLGDGLNPGNDGDYVRRYDENPKVYPLDLVGQVHADGEIIAGAWWDTYLLLEEDRELIMSLFKGAYPGVQATASNGNEGEAYLNVLIDALEFDDDDANLLNGTPNGDAISEGFALHGITFLATAELDHEPVLQAEPQTSIEIEAELDFPQQFIDYLDGVKLFYKSTDETDWVETTMTDDGDDIWVSEIPAQPAGTIIEYYMGVGDVFGNLVAVTPVGSDLEDRNLPNYLLVGYELNSEYDSDTEDDFADWDAGLSTDDATTGQWEEDAPVGSFSDGIPVAPNDQTTPDGEFCFITGNSFSPTDGVGVNDVDGGTTTLQSEEVDLTEFSNPALTYMRWYTNSPPTGANPGADWWQVQVSDDGGDSWTFVEETKTSDASWRRFAFRIADYVDLTEEFMIKFNASDSIRIGQNLDGGSLIEAGLDDFKLYELAEPQSINEFTDGSTFSIFPNPVQDVYRVTLDLKAKRTLSLRLLDVRGKVVESENLGTMNGQVILERSVEGLPSGVYTLEVMAEEDRLTRSIVIE